MLKILSFFQSNETFSDVWRYLASPTDERELSTIKKEVKIIVVHVLLNQYRFSNLLENIVLLKGKILRKFLKFNFFVSKS